MNRDTTRPEETLLLASIRSEERTCWILLSSSCYANPLCGIPEVKWILAKRPVVDPPPLPSVINERYSLVMNIFIFLSNQVTPPATQH